MKSFRDWEEQINEWREELVGWEQELNEALAPTFGGSTTAAAASAPSFSGRTSVAAPTAARQLRGEFQKMTPKQIAFFRNFMFAVKELVRGGEKGFIARMARRMNAEVQEGIRTGVIKAENAPKLTQIGGILNQIAQEAEAEADQQPAPQEEAPATEQPGTSGMRGHMFPM